MTESITIRPYQDIVVNTGRKESGKSFLAKKIVKILKRVIVWDYNREYATILPFSVSNLTELNKLWKAGYTRIAYVPQHRTSREEFEQFLKHIIANYRYLTVVIEEIAIFRLNKKYIPALQDLVDTGRFELKTGLIVTSRRSHGILVDIPYNADYIFAFMQHRPEDIAYLSEYMDSSLIEKLSELNEKGELVLPLHSFVIFTGKDGKSTIHKPIAEKDKIVVVKQLQVKKNVF